MRNDFENKSLGSFLRLLGSQAGAPGGGAAAALTGAGGAAILEMVSRLNDKRLGRSSGTTKKAVRLRIRVQKLIAADAQAFGRIQKAYRLRAKKKALWQKALKAGARPPLLICESCASAATLVKNERRRTSAWLESDRKEALILLRAAYDSARLNVEVNLKEMRDRAYKNRLKRKLKEWRRKFQRS